VLTGVVIALPLAGYLMSRWLQEFASRIDIPWWLFGFAGMCALILAVGTISVQSVRAALSNPTDTLRSE
jgi:putative ABC transport system permease protein